jgi:hypothetical protein
MAQHFLLSSKAKTLSLLEVKGRMIGGEGHTAEVDGGYFGGYVKPANLREARKDRRLFQNRSGKRKCVVIVRERDGNSVPAVFRTEGAALDWIKSRVMKGTTINADEAPSWNGLHAKFEMKRINHEQAYSFDGACTNWAEATSPVCAARKPVSTTISPGLICCATRRRLHGARTTAV